MTALRKGHVGVNKLIGDAWLRLPGLFRGLNGEMRRLNFQEHGIETTPGWMGIG